MNAKETLTATWTREEVALHKYAMISPLLDPDLDSAAMLELRKSIAEQNGLDERTLRRYVAAYRESGFNGLIPAGKSGHRSRELPNNYDDLLREAIQLRREVPRRSVEQIIYILETEGRVAPGVLKRSTLQRHLYNAGFGSMHMDIYADARKSSSKRFCKPHRMMLIQGDVKYGPFLPIGKNGKMIQTYLSSAIDDHSRFILASEFYDNQDEIAIADTFRKAILNYGKFDRCYFDNGSPYIAKQLKLSLAKLSIRIAHAPVNRGAAKGKVEKFHQVVDSYIAEAHVKKIKTLEELNRYWKIYLEEYYHNRPHEGIAEYYKGLGVDDVLISPLQEFNRDTRALVFIDSTVVGKAFLHHEMRKVDKGACISFQGRRYETKTQLIGCTVEIEYDPNASEIITVKHPGVEPFEAKPLTIGSYCDSPQPLPAHVSEVKVETSRFLDAIEKNYNERAQRRADAISFAAYKKNGG